MNRLDLGRNQFKVSWIAVLSISAFLSTVSTVRAGFTLTSSAGTVKYMLDNTTGAGTFPVFDTNTGTTTPSLLLTPGGGFPILTGPASESPTQTNSGSLSPALIVPSVTGFSGNTVPPAFGTANTVIFAQGAGQQGTLTTQGGIFWDTRTSLQDGLLPSDRNLASVSYSSANSTFTNNTRFAVSINPGSILSVVGTVGGSAGSYVAAALTSAYILSGTSTVVNNAGIVIAANATGQTVNQTGNNPLNATSISYFNNQLSVTATSFFGSQPISIASGQSITIAAVLTLIADPMSSISIVSDLAPGFPSLATIPDFGAFAGGTPFSANSVPEPSTITMFGLGLGLATAWAARSRARARRTGRA